jgi:hypothetical protein
MSVAKIKRSYSKFSEQIDECVISTARKFAICIFIVLTNVSPLVNNVFTLRLQHDNKRNTVSS